jgi:PAS domain S-box-containing protein
MNELPIPLARLLQESPNGWLLADDRGVIVFSNLRVTELFGYTADELLGQPVELLVPESMRELHLKHREKYMQHPTLRPMGLGMELQGRRKDGSTFPAEISLSPMTTPAGTYVTAIVRDMTDSVRLEEERNSLRLELEMERERDRIGMDLHDGIMQELYAAGLTLELAVGDVRERPETAEAEIDRGIEQLHAVIRNVRSYIFDLRPRQFTGSLSHAVLELVREFRQNTLIEVHEDIPELQEEDVAHEAANAAYHIVHEALSNVRKHADATQVSVTLVCAPKHVVIEVEDDGHGFDTAQDISQAHRGLRNMDVRARNAGCELEVQSKPGGGTSVVVRVPLPS